jgi:hypothetical protein
VIFRKIKFGKSKDRFPAMLATLESSKQESRLAGTLLNEILVVRRYFPVADRWASLAIDDKQLTERESSH